MYRLALTLLLLAGCATERDARIAGYTAVECPPCVEWNAPHAPFQVFGNTYYVGTDGLSAILLTSLEGHVLIDGGYPETASAIMTSIAELGFDIRDVKILLNTHAHSDHAGGLRALQEASGCHLQRPFRFT